jgi:hypothetical protein
LRRSRNWRADGDGCDGLHLMQVSRGGLNGVTVRAEKTGKPAGTWEGFIEGPTGT